MDPAGGKLQADYGRLQHNMREERREKKKKPDYAPRGVQCGSRIKHLSTKAHTFKQDVQWGWRGGRGGKPKTG